MWGQGGGRVRKGGRRTSTASSRSEPSSLPPMWRRLPQHCFCSRLTHNHHKNPILPNTDIARTIVLRTTESALCPPDTTTG
eukprot:SAG11_NODE_482_length_9072_cov_12.361306_4_plen_81_part_00